jgi:hypothetical protein
MEHEKPHAHDDRCHDDALPSAPHAGPHERSVLPSAEDRLRISARGGDRPHLRASGGQEPPAVRTSRGLRAESPSATPRGRTCTTDQGLFVDHGGCRKGRLSCSYRVGCVVLRLAVACTSVHCVCTGSGPAQTLPAVDRAGCLVRRKGGRFGSLRDGPRPTLAPAGDSRKWQLWGRAATGFCAPLPGAGGGSRRPPLYVPAGHAAVRS